MTPKTKTKKPAKEAKLSTATKCLSLSFVWGIRLKLWAEGNKLRAEGNKLWAEGILEAYGNITLRWTNYNAEKQDYECHLGNGLVFKP